jgi:D-glycero-alpha-D-manno-heptose-7-phosphate kinase
MATIRANAPVRVCDAGGWTDTWFAREGLVCSVAVGPGAEIVVELDDHVGPVTLEVRATNERYTVTPGDAPPGRHPLLEAAVTRVPPPDRRAARVRVASAVPAGSGTGTSAAVVVALLSALRAARDEPACADDVARDAHALETGLGRQSGVQDQYAAAHGGANTIHVERYPQATVRPITLPDDVVAALDARLLTVYLGEPHESSALHEKVIASLERDGEGGQKLQALRDAATDAAHALSVGDLDAFGAALAENTRLQARLDPSLVSADARKLIELAHGTGASGWKVNGAGGEGGSVTVVASADPAKQRALVAGVSQVRRWQRLPLQFARHGVRTSVS